MSSWPRNPTRMGGSLTVQLVDIKLKREKYQKRMVEEQEENKKWLLFFANLIQEEFKENEEISTLIQEVLNMWESGHYRRNFLRAPDDFLRAMEGYGSAECMERLQTVKKTYEFQIMKERMKQQLRLEKERREKERGEGNNV